jgi:hypothetical protein
MVADSAKFMPVASSPDWALVKQQSLLLSTYQRLHQSLSEVSARVPSLVLCTLGLCLHTSHHGEVNFTSEKALQLNGCVMKFLFLQ